ncbi:MAG: dimethylargininase [Candidatus Paceibacteria bacterium]|jgi:dimethylargininase
MLHAIVRKPSESMEGCELTHLEREPIDVLRLRRQHARYVELLVELGCEIHELPAEPNMPDGVFVEDPAIVLDEVAVITRPGAVSRRGEGASLARALQPWRELLHIEEPGTLDGGDVILLGRTLYVGLSSRSNCTGIEQLQRLLAPHGYKVRGVQVAGCLHLKSAACAIGQDRVLIQPDWVDGSQFDGAELLETHPAEVGAANVVWLGESVIYPTAFPSTAAKLEASGLRVHRVEYDELAKAEGAVTCCSLIFRQ